MVPLGSLLSMAPVSGPSLVSLYNLYPSASVLGEPEQGFSSGDAMAAMEKAANRSLPPGAGFEWTAMSYQQEAVGDQIYYVSRAVRIGEIVDLARHLPVEELQDRQGTRRLAVAGPADWDQPSFIDHLRTLL